MRRSIWIFFFAAALSACGNHRAFFNPDSSYKSRPSISFNKPSVIKDGKEWLQPSLFRNLYLKDIKSVCDISSDNKGGKCSGTLNGHDITGYTWATGRDIADLYKSYGAVPDGFCKKGLSLCLSGTKWYTNLMNKFEPTNSPYNRRNHPEIKNFTSDCCFSQQGEISCTLVFMYPEGKSSPLPSRIGANKCLTYTDSINTSERGVFFYRPYTPPDTPVYSEKRKSSVTPDGRTSSGPSHPASAPDF